MSVAVVMDFGDDEDGSEEVEEEDDGLRTSMEVDLAVLVGLEDAGVDDGGTYYTDHINIVFQ